LSTTVNGTTSGSGLAAGEGAAAIAASNDSSSQLFMSLLIAQIQNQDPLSPMESKDFVQQFAAMSQVQSMESLASMTSASTAVQESLLIVGLGGQVGNEVSVASDQVTLGQDVVSGAFVLDGAVKDATVVLKGGNGVTKKIALGAQDAGTVQFQIDPQALGLPSGSYALSVETSNGTAPSTELHGRLLGVRLDASGSVVLDVDGVGEVGTSDIVRFLGRASGSAT